MKKSFLTRIAYTNGLWIAGLLLLLFSAFGDMFYSFSVMKTPEIKAFMGLDGQELFGYPLDSIFKNNYLCYSFRFLLLFGCALLLQFISSEFRLIRVRSFFPFFLFCIFSAAIIPILSLNGASISCFFFCWSCFRLFGSLDSRPVNRAIFDANALLAIASLFQPRIIYMLPVFWIVMGILQVFSFKSFMASIIGVISVFWVIGATSFLMDDYAFLLDFSQNLISFQLVNFSLFSSAEITYVAFLGLLMISAMIFFWPRQHMDKLRTRNYLNSVLLLWFAVLILWIFSDNEMGVLLLLFSLSALMAAHFFSLIDDRYSRVLFFILIILSVSVFFLI